MEVSSKTLGMEIKVSNDIVKSLNVCKQDCLNCLNYDSSSNICNACSLWISFPTFVELPCEDTGSVDLIVDSIGDYLEEGTPESFMNLRKVLDYEKKKKSQV